MENTENTENSQKKKSILKEIISWVLVILAGVALSLFFNNFIVINAEIPTGSMEDTLLVGDRVIGNRLAYSFSEPEREDVVIFLFPDDETELYVKRIVGLPGDTVEVKNGLVYINNSETPLDQSFVNKSATGDYGPFSVPEDSYFMMGDNRDDSWDSRFWDNQFVAKEKIKAKAEFTYYPKLHWVK